MDDQEHDGGEAEPAVLQQGERVDLHVAAGFVCPGLGL